VGIYTNKCFTIRSFSITFSVFFVASLIKAMANCRIDIKNNNENSMLLNQLLKVLVACYIIAASAFLLYKLLFTLPQQPHTSRKEWSAIIINFLLVIILTFQLLKTLNKKFILITDEFVKYRFQLPWSSQLKWKKIKKIQLGYSTVRFITNSEQKHKFNFSKATEQEKILLEETLINIAQKHNIEFMQPS
jgi:hypothetical protein